MIRAAICNNMVTPYTNRLFNHIFGTRRLELDVISCTVREGIRTWAGDYSKSYRHVILKGFEIPLRTTRISHINSGMWSALSNSNPDVVAINGIYPTMIIAAAWARAHRVPLTFVTDGWRHTMPHSLYHRMIRPLILNHCASIICASEKGRRYFMDLGVDPRQIFIAPLTPAWDAPGEVPGFEERRWHLVWCGRLNDSPKNIGFFVELAIAMQKRLSDFQCRVIGDGPLRPWMLHRLSEAGVKFDYTANIPPDKMANEFSQSRMLALPSKLEAWGLVCNEAMQCGTPCIVSHFTGVADELVKDGDSGFVLPLNVVEWTQKIAPPVTDPLIWTKLSEAARRVSALFKVETSAEKYIDGLLFAASARKSQYEGS